MAPALLSVLAPILTQIVGGLFPDPVEKSKAEAEVMKQLLASQGEFEKATAEIIKSEAESEHWLAANWRPLTMLTFVALIVARWFGWAAPNLTEPEYIKLWSIVEIGIGGYVIGRSVEKIAPTIAGALKK